MVVVTDVPLAVAKESPLSTVCPVTARLVEVTEVLDTLGTLKTFVVVLKVKVGVPVTVLSELPNPTKVLVMLGL